jgi:regulation of enolase protein 1 (concanavalin A-like superfamily)
MHSNRRTFLQHSLRLMCATMVGNRLLGEDLQVVGGHGDLIARRTWINKPASCKRSGDKWVARSRAQTDFWRRTFYGYVTGNGHFFHLPVSGNFTFQARVNGQYAALYDQAELMVRRDAKNWTKRGTEVFDGDRL